MGEGIKSDFTMIRSHAAVSNAAKAHLGCCQMDDDIVDASAAKLSVRFHFFDVRLILRKHVQR